MSTNVNDAQKGLDKLNNLTSGKGILGKFLKAFMGNDFSSKAQESISVAQKALDDSAAAEKVFMSGKDAKAEVLSIEDTNQLINYNPLLKLNLKVKSDVHGTYTLNIQKAVSKIMIPRVGDILLIKVDAADKQNIAILGIEHK